MRVILNALAAAALACAGQATWAANTIAPQNGNWIITSELNGKPGRGMGIDVQGGTFLMQVYDYTQTGASTFHLAMGTMDNNKVEAPLKVYKGGRYFGSGPIDGQEAGDAGNVVVTFTSRTTGTIKFPGEDAKPMERFNYEGTPEGTLSDPTYVDRWAMVELDKNNQPVNTWWADIGLGTQINLSYDTYATVAWPYGTSTKHTVYGSGGSLSAPVFMECDYSGANLTFVCDGNSIDSNKRSTPVEMTVQRSLDQLSGTMQFGTNGDVHRIIGARITRSAYKLVNGQPQLATYFRPDSTPEAGTWIVSSEITGKAGRGLSVDVQKPANGADHLLFTPIYNYDRSGNATFHLAFGTHIPSTIPTAYTPRLALNQYKGGRYFGSGDLTATFANYVGDATFQFGSSYRGTVQFPDEDPVDTQRYYFGLNNMSTDSLLGSWVVLAHSGVMKSRFFTFVRNTSGSVIDKASGYVCVQDPWLDFNFRCDASISASDYPTIRFSTGFYTAGRGIIGDGGPLPNSTPELMVMRVADQNGQLVQQGPMFPVATPPAPTTPTTPAPAPQPAP